MGGMRLKMMGGISKIADINGEFQASEARLTIRLVVMIFCFGFAVAFAVSKLRVVATGAEGGQSWLHDQESSYTSHKLRIRSG